MTTPNSRVNAVIGSTISMHPLMGSGCLCGEGPRKYDAVAHEKHLSVVIQEALRAARIALVELPKPDEREDEEQEFTDFPGVGLYVPVVFDRYPGEVQIRAGAWCDEPLSVDEARGLAASILAAASYAEEAEE